MERSVLLAKLIQANLAIFAIWTDKLSFRRNGKNAENELILLSEGGKMRKNTLHNFGNIN